MLYPRSPAAQRAYTEEIVRALEERLALGQAQIDESHRSGNGEGRSILEENRRMRRDIGDLQNIQNRRADFQRIREEIKTLASSGRLDKRLKNITPLRQAVLENYICGQEFDEELGSQRYAVASDADIRLDASLLNNGYLPATLKGIFEDLYCISLDGFRLLDDSKEITKALNQVASIRLEKVIAKKYGERMKELADGLVSKALRIVVEDGMTVNDLSNRLGTDCPKIEVVFRGICLKCRLIKVVV